MYAITHDLAIARCYELAKLSPCSKRKVGSVIVNNGAIVGEGYNHPPNPACQDCATLCSGGIRKGIPSGTRVELCYSGHAEGWAITDAGHQARGGLIYVAGPDSEGNRFLRDKSLPFGDPRKGFYCTMCIRHIWMAGIVGIYTDGVEGPSFESLEEAWATSYAVAGT